MHTLVKLQVAIATVVFGSAVIAGTEQIDFGKRVFPQKFMESKMKRHGGFIEKRDSFKGRIVIVDERAEADTEQLAPAMKSFLSAERYNASVIARRPGDEKCPKRKLAAIGAQVGVFVIDDDQAPSLVVAPEDGWAVVNVNRLVKGVEKSRLAPLRIQKEVLRALGFVAGGMSSQYDKSLAGPVVTPADLDLVGLELPLDVIGAFGPNLKAFGVTSQDMVTYRDACKEGWAAQPTNEIQKAIWDEVHKLPTNPLPLVKPTK